MTIFKSTLLYIGSSALSKGVPFLLLPYLTRVLSPGELGLASIFMLAFTIYAALIGSNSHTVLARSFYRQNKQSDFSELVGNVVTYNLLLFLMVMLITPYLSSYMQGITGMPSYVFLLLPIVIIFNTFLQHLLTLFRCMGKPKQYAFSEIGFSILRVTIVFVYFGFWGSGWQYQLWSTIIATSLFGLFSFFKLQKYYNFSLSVSQLKPVSSLCLPQIFHLLAILALVIGDRLIIQNILGPSFVGLYVVAYSFGVILSELVSAYTRSYGPSIYKLLASEKNSQNQAFNLMIKSILTLIPIAILYYAAVYWLFDFIIGPAYVEVKELLLFIIMGIYFQSIYKFLFPFLLDKKRSKSVALINIVGALCNIVLNLKLIYIYGLLGCAIATLVSYFIIAVCCVFIMNREYNSKPLII